MLKNTGFRMFVIVGLVAFAGGLGGGLNAVMSGAQLGARPVDRVDQQLVLVPGSFGNVLVGAAAALVSFGLYGPLASVAFFSLKARSQAPPSETDPETGPAPAPTQGLTLAALSGAILVGFSGGRWLTSEAEKQYSRATAAMVAQMADSLAVTRRTDGPAPATIDVALSLRALSASIQTDPPSVAFQKTLRLRDQLQSSGPSTP